MNTVQNGNGHGASGATAESRKPAAVRPSAPPVSPKDTQVSFRVAGENFLLQGVPARMTRHAVVFELFNPLATPRLSEVLEDFHLSFHERIIYSGRAVVRTVMDVSAKVICEATLDETGWQTADGESLAANADLVTGEFHRFLDDWQKFYKVTPEFKVVVADMQTFFHDLRLWLNQVEMAAHKNTTRSREAFDREIIARLAKPVSRSIDSLIDRFEPIVARLPAEAHPDFQAYLRRQLHPLLLASPFANRAFNKPLGYAGDYQVVDMMMRPPERGNDLFAKMVNVWLWGQTPAEAHRNRVVYLEKKLTQESLRARARNRPLKVFNLGCGPAAEVQSLAGKPQFADWVDFTLVDFNAETLSSLGQQLETLKIQGQPVQYRLVQKSVNQILKDGGRTLAPAPGEKYDYIYCAGLFDYLSDAVCRQLMAVFYKMLAPEGLLLATNASDVMNDSRPFRYSMEYILDWYLIYRNQKQFMNVLPDTIPVEEATVTAETTGANLFLEVRKLQDV